MVTSRSPCSIKRYEYKRNAAQEVDERRRSHRSDRPVNQFGLQIILSRPLINETIMTNLHNFPAIQ